MIGKNHLYYAKICENHPSEIYLKQVNHAMKLVCHFFSFYMLNLLR